MSLEVCWCHQYVCIYYYAYAGHSSFLWTLLGWAYLIFRSQFEKSMSTDPHRTVCNMYYWNSCNPAKYNMLLPLFTRWTNTSNGQYQLYINWFYYTSNDMWDIQIKMYIKCMQCISFLICPELGIGGDTHTTKRKTSCDCCLIIRAERWWKGDGKD